MQALEKEMATHSSILAGESHGQKSLVGYSPWDRKESDMTERLCLVLVLWTNPNIFISRSSDPPNSSFTSRVKHSDGPPDIRLSAPK